LNACEEEDADDENEKRVFSSRTDLTYIQQPLEAPN